ncbi:metallophosphoesterase [Paenibacillus sp. MMS20-IR301]|uniref:metallophosphoesterase n=1 Tax=Paenibacillus sp. MMS20-IR301 TaxID=2895946 RepID=UPI0028EB1C8A|nr:metallophosphoesterase [Paenibacillus sp. MMS20-IR301]WNS44467.1 metallophosphoesterase family protein [Paenibacillus sp. MMS20-IR301]
MVTAVLLVLLGLCAGAAAVMAVLMVAGAFRSRIIAEEIVLAGLPGGFDGYRILFITDIHRRRLPAALLEEYRGELDAVFLGGDLTEKGVPLKRLRNNLALAASLAPVYAVHGNHDYQAEIRLVDQLIRSSGARLLVDENVKLECSGAEIVLTGVDFPRTGGKRAYHALPPVTARDDGAFRIILVHDPLWLAQQKEVPADLILAGHTHGGQVVLPFIASRHADEFYRHYNAGMYDLPAYGNDTYQPKMLISRGFGTAHLPLRWGSPAEMHLLTLRCRQE